MSRRFTINIPDSLKYYAYLGSWVTRVRLVFLLFFSNNYCKKDKRKSLRGIQVSQFLLKCRRGCDFCHAKLEISIWLTYSNLSERLCFEHVLVFLLVFWGYLGNL